MTSVLNSNNVKCTYFNFISEIRNIAQQLAEMLPTMSMILKVLEEKQWAWFKKDAEVSGKLYDDACEYGISSRKTQSRFYLQTKQLSHNKGLFQNLEYRRLATGKNIPILSKSFLST